MSKVRILSKKSFAFGPGASRDGKKVDQFVTVPGAIQEIPEEYTHDRLFGLAVKEGSVVIMNANVQVEAPVIKDVPVTEAEPTNEEKIAKFKEELKSMKPAEVMKVAEEYGAEFDKNSKMSENKKRILEAYKLSLQ